MAHRRGVIMRALVAFPAAAVDAREAGEAQLGLIVLQGLVSHHARARGPGAQPSGAHGGPRLVLREEAQVCEAGEGWGVRTRHSESQWGLGRGGPASAQSSAVGPSPTWSQRPTLAGLPGQSPATHP